MKLNKKAAMPMEQQGGWSIMVCTIYDRFTADKHAK